MGRTDDSIATGYCIAGTSASGCNAVILRQGVPSATASSGFTLSASNVEGRKNGMFFFGSSGRQAKPWGQSTSLLCVMLPVKRGAILPGVGTSGACDGWFNYDFNAHWAAKPRHNPGPGAIVQAQLWYRDPHTAPLFTSMSNAIEFTVSP